MNKLLLFAGLIGISTLTQAQLLRNQTAVVRYTDSAVTYPHMDTTEGVVQSLGPHSLEVRRAWKVDSVWIGHDGVEYFSTEDGVISRYGLKHHSETKAILVDYNYPLNLSKWYNFISIDNVQFIHP